MSFFKNLFGGSKKKTNFDKSFQKCIMKSCIATHSLAKIQADDLTQIRLYLEGRNSLKTEDALKQFFQIIESGTFTIPSRLKILTTFHKFIIELGELFALEFLQYRFLNLLDHVPKKPKQILYHVVDVDDWINENVLTYYFNYLLRLANNYQIYKICIEEGQLPQTEDAKLDYKLKFMWLFKLSNIFSYILKMHLSFKKVFKDYPSYFLVQDIALLVLHDCVSYYNVMSKEMGDLVQTYPLLTTIDSIQFYQVYTELNTLTQSMNTFFFMKQQFDQFDYIIEPKWFYVTAKVHKEIEMYSRKVELLHTSAANMRRTLKNGDGSNHNAHQGVNFTETAQYEKSRSKSTLVYSKQPNKQQQQQLPESKILYSQSQKLQKQEDSDEDEIESNQNCGGNQQHNRMKTENIFYAAKSKNENYVDQLQKDDIYAIQQYEQLLKQQKSFIYQGDQHNNNHQHTVEQINQQQINLNVYNPQNISNNYQKNMDEEEDEGEEQDDNQEEEGQDQFKNKNEIINQMQQVINQQSNLVGQEIYFSPDKPYTFRCDNQPEPNQQQQQNPQIQQVEEDNELHQEEVDEDDDEEDEVEQDMFQQDLQSITYQNNKDQTNSAENIINNNSNKNKDSQEIQNGQQLQNEDSTNFKNDNGEQEKEEGQIGTIEQENINKEEQREEKEKEERSVTSIDQEDEQKHQIKENNEIYDSQVDEKKQKQEIDFNVSFS